ncbi:MAG: hypothetical protein HY318_18390, partial [Armatimonadetes bacterium]|nr:hypothetical protein [Armatimonadota bacterium]
MISRILLPIVLLALLRTVGLASEVIHDVRPLSLTPIERAALESQPRKLHDLPLKFSPFNTQRPREPQRHGVLSDRVEYWADDTVGQFVVYFIGEQLSSPGVELTIRLVSEEGNTTGQTIDSHKVSRPAAPKYALLVRTGLLSPGRYRLSAELTGIPGARKIPDCVFVKSDRQRPRVTFPGGGIPIIVSPQEVLRETLWPINTGVPLPRNAVKTVDRLVLLEEGRPVPAQISTRATWYPGQEAKWLGLDFLARYSKGKPASYRLALLPEERSASPLRSSLRVTESGGSFVVETGKVRFVVNRRRFTGIEGAWLTEKKGDYSQQTLRGEGGPALVDERGVLFRASDDPSPTVRLMDQGPVRVTIQASGWYTSSRYNERLCKFQTWISAYAGQSRIDLTHRTLLTYDTGKKKLADLRFDFKTTTAKQWSCGADGKTLGGPFLQTNETVWIHQDRWDHYRLATQNGETTQGKRSDGWAAVAQSFGVTA